MIDNLSGYTQTSVYFANLEANEEELYEKNSDADTTCGDGWR